MLSSPYYAKNYASIIAYHPPRVLRFFILMRIKFSNFFLRGMRHYSNNMLRLLCTPCKLYLPSTSLPSLEIWSGQAIYRHEMQIYHIFCSFRTCEVIDCSIEIFYKVIVQLYSHTLNAIILILPIRMLAFICKILSGTYNY